MKKRLLAIGVLLFSFSVACFAQLNQNPCKFLGNITTRGQIQPNVGGLRYEALWDQLTCENESKWGSIVNCKVNSAQEGVQKWNWKNSDAHYKWCKENGVLFKFHCLLWTSQWPSCLANCSATELKQQVEYWMDAVAIKYPDLSMIDVVNEAIRGHAEGQENGHSCADFKKLLSQALGNSTNPYDYKWIAEAFRMARKRFPNAVLIYNDYNTFTWQKNDFIDLVASLVQQGAPIDAYGHQSHDLDDYYKNNQITNFGNTLKEIHNSITQKAGKELLCYITEFDISQGDDNTYETIMKNTFKPMWEADYVAGITIWGFVNGATWRDNTGLVTSSGADRSGMKWLKSYMATDEAKNAKSPYCGGPSATVNLSSKTIKFGETVTITASAKFEGDIDHIDIFDGDSLLVNKFVAPYVWEYTPTEAGFHTIKVVAYDKSGNTVECSTEFFVCEARAPYNGAPIAIPGTVEVEEFDKGCEGEVYQDSDSENEGDATIQDGGVDIVTGGDNYAIGYTAADEWLEYTVNVKKSGEYKLSAFAASGLEGSGFKLDMDGKALVEKVSVPQTGDNDWSIFEEIELGEFNLTEGEHILRMTITNPYCNIDKLVFTSTTTSEETGVKEVDAISNFSGICKVYSLQGSLITSAYIDNGNLSALKESLKKGVYLVRCENGLNQLVVVND
ncbi:MAG: endo-1,4-beta-xylanase [Paludibacteraceae bacterium]|nr:endo-1,4-beta-xylanase [Paludibacteraceae bacterium]MBQ9101309.1 endo-1,4-beta-xylanase [Paludibacteraceae bacterium]